MAVYYGDPFVLNSIIYGNSPGQIDYIEDKNPDGTKDVYVTYTDVQDGWSGTGNIDATPEFEEGPDGIYYLSHIAAGQVSDSPCIDAGNDAASNICFETEFGIMCMDYYSTRTDQIPDSGQADMGYHYSSNAPTPTPTPTPSATPTLRPPTTIYVDDVTDPEEDGSLAHPFDSILEGVTAAIVPGDTVMVMNGTYTGASNRNIDYSGRAISVQSQSGAANCIIDCENADRAFIFDSGESTSAVLDGFTIRNGSGSPEGGAIYCNNASPVIRNNIIESCHASSNGGAICCRNSAHAKIQDNIIRNNTSEYDAGGIMVYGSNPEITGNIITGNTGDVYSGGISIDSSTNTVLSGNTLENNYGHYSGGGVYSENSANLFITDCFFIGNHAWSGGAVNLNDTAATLTSCIFDSNYTDENGTPRGGALFIYSQTTQIINCGFMNNESGQGGALYYNSAVVNMANCTVRDNTAVTSGGGFCCDGADGSTLLNCIVYWNEPNQIHVASGSSPGVTYTDIQGGWAGTGNFDSDPFFWGDFYLGRTDTGQPWTSPCFDVGSDLSSAVCFPEFSGAVCMDMMTARWDHLADSGTVDLGFHREASAPTPTPFTPSPTRTPTPTPRPPMNIYVDDQTDPLEDGSFEHPYDTIQEGMNAAEIDGDAVVLMDGVYTGAGNVNLEFQGKAMSVESMNGPENCVIDCQSNTRAFSFNDSEGPGSRLEGLTIMNSFSGRGAVLCPTNASPVIEGNRFINNPASAIYYYGSSPSIISNEFINNSDNTGGGAIYGSSGSPLISGNLFDSNVCYGGEGGAIAIYNNAFPVVTDNVFRKNKSWNGGGAVFIDITNSNNVVVSNNLFENNRQLGGGETGGGALLIDVYYGSSISPVAVYNNTFVNNSSAIPGGALYCKLRTSSVIAVRNCIFRDNTPDQIVSHDTHEPVVTYCDVQDGYPGTGNIDADPLFVSGPLGHFYLSQSAAGQGSDSPCLNAGDDSASSTCFDTGSGTECLDEFTTRTDEFLDSGTVDLGYHYRAGLPAPTPTPTPPMPRTLYVDDVTDPLEDGSESHPFDAIQEALDEAISGDTVWVLPGTYTGAGNRNMDPQGKGITIRSSQGPDETFIDLNDTGRGFILHSAEDENLVIQGFTILDGFDGYEYGGAIFCGGCTSPVIRGNVFLSNSTNSGGGAISFSSAAPTIIDNYFQANSAGQAGGALHANSGAGVILGNTFISNSSSGSAGAIYSAGSYRIVLNNNIIKNNTSSTGPGGAYILFLNDDSAHAEIANNLFTGNHTGAQNNGSGLYMYIYDENSEVEISNCTFAGNTGAAGSAGIRLYLPATNLTSLENCILWDNSPLQTVMGSTGEPSVEYCDIQGGWTGTGNIDLDPGFITGPSGDYYLSQVASGQGDDSPCLDTGNTTADALCYSGVAETVYLDSRTTRTDEGLDSGVVDMGYHYIAYSMITPTATPTTVPTLTPSPVSTETPTPAPTDTPEATHTHTSIPTDTPTAIPSGTATPVPSDTPTPIPTAIPTLMPTDTPTAVPSMTPTPVPSDTPTLEPTQTFTPEPTDTPSPVPTETPTVTPFPTSTPTDIPTAMPTGTPTFVPTGTATAQPTNTSTPVPTGTPTPALTATPTDTSTVVPTLTATPVPTETPTAEPTQTQTPVPTLTTTPVPTDTPEITHTPTSIPTDTGTPTITPTPTITHTPGLPNLIINNPQMPSEIIAGRDFTVGWRVFNTGGLTAFGPWTDCVYLSLDDTAGDDIELTCEESVESELPHLYSYEQQVTVNVEGLEDEVVWLIVATDTGMDVEEAVEDDNTVILGPILLVNVNYEATVETDFTSGFTGDSVPMYGEALSLDTGLPVPDVPVAVEVRVRNTERRFLSMTDGSGAFELTFYPLSSEAGMYQIAAGHPLDVPDTAQDTFELLGMRVYPETVSYRMVPYRLYLP